MITALGLDIGGTQIKGARVDAEGRVLDRRSIPTPRSLDEFAVAFRAMAAELGGGSVDAVGIGCKGLIEPETTRVVVSPGPVVYLEGHSLAELAGVNAPVVADNDARVALAGEVVWGAARGLRNALMFTLGTGVGGGILADGRIVRGATGVAGHLGHVTVDPDGVPCICGNRGCLETVFSARVIEAEAFSAIHRSLHTSLAGHPTCAQVFEAAAQGDAIAARIVDRATFRLAAAIAGLMLALDPEAVILGGNIAGAGEMLREPLRREIRDRTRVMLPREVAIVRSQVEDGVIGAAALAMAVIGSRGPA